VLFSAGCRWWCGVVGMRMRVRCARQGVECVPLWLSTNSGTAMTEGALSKRIGRCCCCCCCALVQCVTLGFQRPRRTHRKSSLHELHDYRYCTLLQRREEPTEVSTTTRRSTAGEFSLLELVGNRRMVCFWTSSYRALVRWVAFGSPGSYCAAEASQSSMTPCVGGTADGQKPLLMMI